MNEETTRDLLLQIAGYLTLIEKGLPASRQEAAELLEKIGQALRPHEL